MKRLLLVTACLLTVIGLRAQSLRTCRYWYDRDIGDAITTNLSGNIGQLQLDVEALVGGLHTLHLQVADSSLNWGPTKSFLFIKPENYSIENLSYRCWFDYDIESQQNGSFGNSLLLDVTNLDCGIHTLHLQLEGSTMTSTKSYLFLKPEDYGVENLSYRCWFDYDVENQQSGFFESGSLLLDVSNLNDGIHTLHFQLVGSTMVSTKSYIFMKVPTYSGEIQYRCWFDESDSIVLTGQVSNGVLLLDVTSLSIGQHNLNMQFFNGNLSSPRSFSFYRGPAIIVSANPVEGGTVSTQLVDSICTITATANPGYTFVNWTENGSQVSTNASHSFAISDDDDRTFVANFMFTGVNYTVNATANPVEGGVVTGEGTYGEGSTCVLTTTPNEGYTFVNWTENGNQVSTNADYTFTVSGNRTLVANFMVSTVDYTINALAYPSNGGTVTGFGTYSEGSTCTLIATASVGYTFINWMEDGVIVSTNSDYSFTVLGNRNLVAHFDSNGHHWTPESANYSEVMTMNSVIQIDGVEQYSGMLEVGVFCGDECRGSAIAAEFPLMNRYLVILTVYGEVSHQLTFKLYDHSTNQELDLISPAAVTFTENGYGTPIEPYILNFISTVAITATVAPEDAGTVTGTGNYAIGATCALIATANSGYQFLNWTLNGVEISTNASYQFTVSGAEAYVANFQHCHNQNLAYGWNWWSTYIEQEGIDGLEMLESSIGNSGIRIQGRTGNVDYFEYQGTSCWYGNLNAIANEQMYKIRTNADCNAVIVGDLASPSNHPITISNGWNWIGFPCGQSQSLDEVMSGFTPEANDVIKGRNGSSTFISYGSYNLWYGTLTVLEPGQGYMYKSNGDETKTLTFQTERGNAVGNATKEDGFFTPNTADYSSNMLVTAVVEMDGEELRSEEYELAAFVGDECRGSVRLMYVEPLDRYVAFLLVYGDEPEEVRFVLTDGNEVVCSGDCLTYAPDGIEGTPTEPVTLHFGTLGLNESGQDVVNIFPNPSDGIFSIEGRGVRKIEVVDAYGQMILSKEIKNDFERIDLSDKADGLYLLRVVTSNGITTKQLIKK